jgi:hypothetical protein
MSTPLLDKKLDATPLVKTILEKTRVGKLRWEATAKENVFIASVGGNTTFKIYLDRGEDFNPVTNSFETIEFPVLSLLDEKGKTLWEIRPGHVEGGLDPLFAMARRVANKLDERMEALIGVLERL